MQISSIPLPRSQRPEASASDDDGQAEQPEEQQEDMAARKRSTRACDQCRKTKSKCERSPPHADQCKSCAAAGLMCTYEGPSFKRGPPKGYIHAIEQRWHQVESILGAIIASQDTRAQSVLSDLRQDPLAREIIHRVEAGPFGPLGRMNYGDNTTKEDLFSSILEGSSRQASGRENPRSRRQSRISREIVSSVQDPMVLAAPTSEWQDLLSARLAASSNRSSPYGVPLPSTSPTIDYHGTPILQRRRHDIPDPPGVHGLYTMEPEEQDDYDSAFSSTDGINRLSLDENKEIRYHGDASGLHLLGRNERIDQRKEDGIWKLPMARTWPRAEEQLAQGLSWTEDNIEVKLPPLAEQERMIDLYFTFIHPQFPVLHKEAFMDEFRRRNYNNPASVSAQKRGEVVQEVTKLLLLSIFSTTSRFAEDPDPNLEPGRMWEVGCDYLDDAREILSRVGHRSSLPTCQALLILGIREFGIGNTEGAWLNIGIGIRMAYDLGLNHSSDGWKFKGVDLFSPDTNQLRKYVWWTYRYVDNCASLTLGRPMAIRESDYNTSFVDIDEKKDQEVWKALPHGHRDTKNYIGVQGFFSSCFRVSSSLTTIMSAILSDLYAVRPLSTTKRKASLDKLETNLGKWYNGLPDNLQYDLSRQATPPPPPHIFILHIRYWTAFLLLYRAFIPNRGGAPDELRKAMEGDALATKCFAMCQQAANHIGTIATNYKAAYTLKTCSPMINSYIMNAAVMHVVSLTLRPSDVQASRGLQLCIEAMEDMEIVWPSARRSRELLRGTHVFLEQPPASSQDTLGRTAKRNARNAFGQENVWGGESSGGQEAGGLMIARMLGFNMPGLNPSYIPYNTGGMYNVDWWAHDPTAQGSAAGPHVSLPETAPGGDDPRSSSRSAATHSQLLVGPGTYPSTGNPNPNWINPGGHYSENYSNYPGASGNVNRYEA